MAAHIQSSPLQRGLRSRSVSARGLLYAIVAAGILAGGPAFASQSATNGQQQKMKACNTQASAKSLSGDSRKSFMSTCLSAKPAQSKTALNSQQQKMKTCNTQATSQKLTGDARSKYVTSCLKG
jgi:predicted Zn-dependent peptidase